MKLVLSFLCLIVLVGTMLALYAARLINQSATQIIVTMLMLGGSLLLVTFTKPTKGQLK